MVIFFIIQNEKYGPNSPNQKGIPPLLLLLLIIVTMKMNNMNK